jgi:hypothetical protein
MNFELIENARDDVIDDVIDRRILLRRRRVLTPRVMVVMMRDATLVQSRVRRFIIMIMARRRGRIRFALRLKAPLDARVFPIGFDLFDFERDAQPLRKVAFGDRVIARFRAAGVEVLVIPEKRRRDD